MCAHTYNYYTIIIEVLYMYCSIRAMHSPTYCWRRTWRSPSKWKSLLARQTPVRWSFRWCSVKTDYPRRSSHRSWLGCSGLYRRSRHSVDRQCWRVQPPVAWNEETDAPFDVHKTNTKSSTIMLVLAITLSLDVARSACVYAMQTETHEKGQSRKILRVNDGQPTRLGRTLRIGVVVPVVTPE